MKKKGLKIAIVGHALSGKDAAARYLEEKYGFKHISTGEMIREFVSENNLGDATRDLLREVGIRLRREYGPEYLVRKVFEKGLDEHHVVSGLRAKGEIDFFHENGGVIIAIEAPIKLRYKRAMKRKRASDHVSFEEFYAQEQAEMQSDDPNMLSIEHALDSADFTIKNDKDLAYLHEKLDKIVEKIGL